MEPRVILISRTDSIGDVVLTLPVAVVLRQAFPGAVIAFLGKAYTQAVIEACPAVDVFVDMEDFLGGPGTVAGKLPDVILHIFPRKEIAGHARKLRIPLRIGTTNRLWHWWTCNRLVRLSRKNSDLHESQLNLKLLSGLGMQGDYGLAQIGNMPLLEAPRSAHTDLLVPGKRSVILHPKSAGSAREWGEENFLALIDLLWQDGGYQVFVSGTEGDRAGLTGMLARAEGKVTDITGRMSLPEFMAFIAACDVLVAASTGPLHLAAALGRRAVGIYPPLRPMHPGRWAPVGRDVQVLVGAEACGTCRKSAAGCTCLAGITPDSVFAAISRP